MALPPPSPAAGMMPPDPTMAAGAPDPTDPSDDTGGSDTVLVTISQTAAGGYMVYSGDEPDDDSSDGADMSGADAGAMSDAAGGAAPPGAGAGGAPAAAAGGGMGGNAMGGGGSAGQPASSIGAALKICLDILNEAEQSSGGEGSSNDQMAAGYGASKDATPLSGPRQKY